MMARGIADFERHRELVRADGLPCKIQNNTSCMLPSFAPTQFFLVRWHKGEETPEYFRWCLVHPLVEGDLHCEPAAANFCGPHFIPNLGFSFAPLAPLLLS